MNHLAVIAGLTLLYFLNQRVCLLLDERNSRPRNRFRNRNVHLLQELVVNSFSLVLWVLAIIVGLTA